MSVLQALIDRDLTPILDDVCRQHHVTREEICSRLRTRTITTARHDLWWRLRNSETLFFSYVEIGRLFERNHATVLVGVRAWEKSQSFGAGGALPSRAPMSVESSSA